MKKFRNRMGVAAVVAAIGAWATASPSWAQSNDPTSGDVVIFPAPSALEYTPRAHKPKSVVPGLSQKEAPAMSTEVGKAFGVHLPGNNFKPGSGWWVLLCKPSGKCRIAQARMGFNLAMHPVYDGDPVESQVLSWVLVDTVQAKDEVMLAQFKPIRSMAAMPLKAGEVPTLLHREMSEYPDTSSLGRAGTMEVLIPTPGQTTLMLPRLQRKPSESNVFRPGSPANENDGMVLELRSGQQRQVLETFETGGIDGIPVVFAKNYLVWAGDLDGDGKPDYIVNTSGSNSSRMSLYLSSKAKPGEIVGLVGSFSFYDPSSAGC